MVDIKKEKKTVWNNDLFRSSNHRNDCRDGSDEDPMTCGMKMRIDLGFVRIRSF